MDVRFESLFLRIIYRSASTKTVATKLTMCRLGWQAQQDVRLDKKGTEEDVIIFYTKGIKIIHYVYHIFI